MPELPDLNSPEFAPIKARFARAYLEHKADLGVPNASDEAVLARVDDITAILFASSVRAWRTDDQRWKELVCSDHERAARRRAGQASRRLQPVPCRANEGGMDDDESAQARRTIADNMIDKLVDRLPGHTRTQRLALLREAFSEVRHRSFAHSPPVALDASGKPLPPSRGEQVFADVGDVLLGELAAIFNNEATTLDG